MLILLVPIGKPVHIGEDILVTVESVRKTQVKIGVDAPRKVRVSRPETLDKPTYPSGAFDFDGRN